METGLLLQYVVIALAVLASGLYVVKRLMPGQVRRWRIACATPLLREGRGPLPHAIGRWLAPPPARAGGGGSCGGCDSCGPDDKASRGH